MDYREINYLENNFCHGCLSFGRRCSSDSDNASLFYQLLDPFFNIVKEPITLVLCWECEATLKRIRIFQNKANKAQACLHDVIANKIEHKSLSTLIQTTKKIYDLNINTEIHDTQPSSSLTEDKVYKLVLKRLNSTDSKIKKVSSKSKNLDITNADIKVNKCNGTEDENQVSPTEINIENNTNEEKYSIAKDENCTNLENAICKLDGLKCVIKKSEIIEPSQTKIKQELDDYYSDDNYLGDDHITLDVTAKEIKSEKLITDNVYKKYKFKVQKNRAKRTLIDYNKVETYFNKLVLAPDAFRVQLNKWAKEKRFRLRKYKCTACAICFNNETEEQLHKELHNNTTEHKCAQCNLSFNSGAELASHSATHEFQQCIICAFVCRTQIAREAHLKGYHSRGFWQCDQCTLCFRLQTELTVHRDKLHRTFICDYCNKKRNSKESLQKHILANHMPLKVKCHLCERKFRRRYQLKEHLIDVHDVPGLSTASKESTYCVECNKQYTSMHKYLNHLNTSTVHRPKKKILVPCPECGKIFTKKTYLNNHFKLFHGGGTKHRCDPCNKCYATGYGLRMHILRYHKKIPMPKTKVCETCGLGFQTNRILMHHMRTHTGERPYECSYCPARFAQKYARDVHVRNVHLKHLQHFIS